MGSIQINMLNKVASKIAKRPVLVEYGPCVLAGAEGETGVKGGVPIITLVPWNTAQKTYFFFLHELGHVCLGHDKDLVDTTLKAGSIRYTAKDFAQYKGDPLEAAAKGYAKALNERAEIDAWRYAEKGKFIARLLALLNE